MRYLIYARVSPKGSAWDCHETSIPDQIAQCESYVKARDPDAVVETAVDEFKSASSARRPAYQKILKQLKEGTAEWDVIVVRHIDRLNRSLADSMEILKRLERAGKGMISTTQQLDLSTPTGRAMLHIILTFAQWEREMNSERTKMKMRSIAANGGWPAGICPIGYKRAGKGENVLVIDPVPAEDVKGTFRDYASGMQPKAIVEKYGWKNRQRLYQILRNQFYIGIIEYAGETFQGKHEPLISRELWDAAASKTTPTGSDARENAWTYPYILTGNIKCTCGRFMTPASAGGRNKTYYYYQCTDGYSCKRRVSAPAAEEVVLTRLQEIELDDKDIHVMEQMAMAYYENLSPSIKETNEVRTALGIARRDLERIKKMFVTGIVSSDNAGIFNKELTQANNRVQRLTGRLDALEAVQNRSTEDLFNGISVLKGLKDLKDGLERAGDVETKKMVINTFVEEVVCTEEGFDVRLNLDGSSNGDLWLAGGDLIEPARLVIRISGDGVEWLIA